MDTTPPPLWEIVSLEQRSIPKPPATEAVRSGLLAIWDSLRKPSTPSDSELPQQELQLLPGWLLDRVVSPPQWDKLAEALHEPLFAWMTQAQDGGRRLLAMAGPPGCGIPDALTYWGQKNHWSVAEPPTTPEILAGGQDWFQTWAQEDDTGLIIPQLERCYLRHHRGLNLLRRLVDWAIMSRRLCILGCDSWAWAYFRQALHITQALPSPLSVEGFDARRLQRWFRRLAQGPHVFRLSDDGSAILPTENSAAEETAANGKGAHESEKHEVEEVPPHQYLRQLAARARGIPGVARAIWRYSLRVQDELLSEKAQEAASEDQGHTIWVRPWSQLELPKMPADCSESDMIVLHTLLLQAGLSSDTLSQLLPFSEEQTKQSLFRLRLADLVEPRDDEWRVTPLGYPVVRQYLDGAGYLLDDC